MGKPCISGGYILLFCLTVFKRLQVFGSLVALSVYREHFLITVGNNKRRNYDGNYYAEKNYHADYRQRIFKQFAHTVLEEGNGLAHNILLLLFLCGRRSKLAQVYLRRKNAFLRQTAAIC